MKKLTLDLSDLRVVSFDTVDASGARGTVNAHGYTEPGYPSCDRTCGASPPPESMLCAALGGPTLKACCY